MTKLTGIELKRARLVPSSVFTSPGAVTRAAALTRAQKIEILRRWEFDARRTDDDAGRLDQVRDALAALGALPPNLKSARALRH